MSRNRKTHIALLALCAVAACGPTTPGGSRAAPDDPIGTVPLMPLPVASLAGENTLLLAVGTVVLGDSVMGFMDRRTALLAAANAALDTALRRDAREVTWHGLGEQRRVLRRNPAMRVDPDRLPTAYLLQATEAVPEPLWSDIRTLAALTGARFAVVPAVVRLAGVPNAVVASYVLIAVDARTGRVVWRGRTDGRPAATPEAALVSAAAAAIPNPLAPPTPLPGH